jgi:hypothetical protein
MMLCHTYETLAAAMWVTSSASWPLNSPMHPATIPFSQLQRMSPLEQAQ